MCRWCVTGGTNRPRSASVARGVGAAVVSDGNAAIGTANELGTSFNTRAGPHHRQRATNSNQAGIRSASRWPRQCYTLKTSDRGRAAAGKERDAQAGARASRHWRCQPPRPMPRSACLPVPFRPNNMGRQPVRRPPLGRVVAVLQSINRHEDPTLSAIPGDHLSAFDSRPRAPAKAQADGVVDQAE